MTSILDALTVHLRFPRELWQRIRPTSVLNAPFGAYRRNKVIGAFW